jgi:hypothetical protein
VLLNLCIKPIEIMKSEILFCAFYGFLRQVESNYRERETSDQKPESLRLRSPFVDLSRTSAKLPDAVILAVRHNAYLE